MSLYCSSCKFSVRKSKLYILLNHEKTPLVPQKAACRWNKQWSGTNNCKRESGSKAHVCPVLPTASQQRSSQILLRYSTYTVPTLRAYAASCRWAVISRASLSKATCPDEFLWLALLKEFVHEEAEGNTAQRKQMRNCFSVSRVEALG